MDLVAHVRRSQSVRASLEAVYALLADVPRSVAHFPEMEELLFANGVYTWKLKKLGAGPLIYQVVYGARYHFDASRKSVRWEPVAGVGNAEVSGQWILQPEGSGCNFTMEAQYTVHTPFPRLMKSAAEAIMHRENERIIGSYLENLATTLHGGDGRVRK